MGLAFLWGVVAGSSLLIGGLLAMQFRIGSRLLGLIMAFGAGVLISAVSFELVLEAAQTSLGEGGIAAGLAAGALVFFVGDWAIDRFGGENRKRSQGVQEGASGPAIVLGIVLDGVPESMVIGLTLLEGGGVSVAIISAVFLSNLPEAMAATTGLERSGWARRHIVWLWLLLLAVTAVSSLIGYTLFGDASARTVAFVLAFAGGAILTMLADTMMPEAFEESGKVVGLATALGFALSFALTLAE